MRTPARSTAFRFPSSCAPSFGTRGANMPAILRAIVACGWFGIQSWIGGQAIARHARCDLAGVRQRPRWSVWACFLGFWLLNMFVVWRGVETIRFLQGFSAPFMLVMSLTLLLLDAAQGRRLRTHAFGAQPLPLDRQLSALLLSVADGDGRLLGDAGAEHSRLHPLLPRSQDAQVVGQAFGLPVAMTLYSFIGIACTSASAVIFGEPIWSPIDADGTLPSAGGGASLR